MGWIAELDVSACLIQCVTRYKLSLNLSCGVSDAEGKSTVKEAEYILHPSTAGNLQKPEETAQTCEHLGALHCSSRPREDLEYENETTANDKLQDCETVSLSDTDATFSYSTDSSDAASAGSSVTSGYESSFAVSDHNWDTLMKKYEPVLQDCLLGNRSTLKIKSLILRLQRLQEKAIEEDDYDRADKFRRKLEELEKEKNTLKFQLPSRHPSISSFLDRFITQVQAALRCAADHRIALKNIDHDELLPKPAAVGLRQRSRARGRSPAPGKDSDLEIPQSSCARSGWPHSELPLPQGVAAGATTATTALRQQLTEEWWEIQHHANGRLKQAASSAFRYLQEKEQSFSMSIKETTAKHCQVRHKTTPLSTTSTCLLNTPRDGDSTTSLGSLVQCLTTLLVNKLFLISNLNLPWCNLRPFPLALLLVVVESNKVFPQPLFLQAEQPQFPQLPLIRLVLQTLHQLCCPSLDTLQHLNVFLIVRGPKLNTVFEGHDHSPSPACHAISDIGLLGHLGTLLAHIQLAVDQHPWVLLCWAAFQPLFPKPVALHGVAVTQVQDLALSLVEPHTFGPSPSIHPVQVPLQSLPTLKQINTPAQLGVICKFTEGALDPLVQIIDKDVKQNWPQY
ncbi:hypothetical protein QYF61_016834 [Mycteria americana]|uniref:Uncharacterized protein n=1 Tax=Mycteria americana TaxID=33587 RepID=A0AAN7NH95_MYCAM|nr:hypothetical protein QYF61_016834 [Mycteria americana]